MCKELFLICFLGLVSVIQVPAESIMTLSISSYDNKIECDQTKAKLKNYKTTLFEKEPLELKVKYTKRINYIQCSRDGKPLDIIVPNPDDSRRNPVTIPEVTSKMAGVWNCTILVHKHNTVIKPNINYGGIFYAAAYCYIQVHVALLEPPLMVLVNRISLPTPKRSLVNKDVNYAYTYNYSSGDMVDAFCVNSHLKCEDIILTYDYAEKLDDMFKTANMMNDPDKAENSLGAGFRATLRAEHKDSQMTCVCGGTDVVVKVTFVLSENYGNNMTKLTINGRAVRQYMYKNGIDIAVLEINYISIDEKQINVTCAAYRNDIAFENYGNCEQISADHKNANKNTTVVRADKPCKLSFTVKVGTSQEQSLQIEISTPLSAKFNELPALTMDFSDNGSIMEVYEYKNKHLIYYEYSDGDNVTVTCSKRDVVPGPPTCIEMYNKNYCQEQSASKNLYLSPEYDNKNLDCILGQSEPENSEFSRRFKTIRVVFHMRVRTTTTEMTSTVIPTNTDVPPAIGQSGDHTPGDPQPESNNQFLIIVIVAVAGVMCIVLVCVATIIYKMRKQTPPRDSSVSNYENLAKTAEMNIYNVPVDRLEEAYATPIPKCQRPGRPTKDYPEPTYAELNMPQGVRVSQSSELDRSPYATVGDVYTQVLPKCARKNNQEPYTNVFPDSRYVNSGNTEYVEPTYCQPYIK